MLNFSPTWKVGGGCTITAKLVRVTPDQWRRHQGVEVGRPPPLRCWDFFIDMYTACTCTGIRDQKRLKKRKRKAYRICTIWAGAWTRKAQLRKDRSARLGRTCSPGSLLDRAPCSLPPSIRRRPPLVAPCSIRRPGAAAGPFALHRVVAPPSLPYSPIPNRRAPRFPA